MAKELLKRSEVKRENTWALEDLYKDRGEWEADFLKVKELAKVLEQKKGTMISSAAELKETLDLWASCGQKLDYMASYAARKSDEDTANAANLADDQKMTAVYVDISSRLAFIEPTILELPDDILKEYVKQEPGLSLYGVWFEEIRRTRSHHLSAEMEELLASAGEIQQTPDQIFSLFNDADIQFPEIQDEDGDTVRVTHGRFIPMQNSSDRRVRREAFKALYSTYEKFKNTLAAVYSGQVKQLMFEAKARHYGSNLEAAVDGNNVSPQVYENLIETVNENLDKMHRYVGLRKRMLGVEELHMYDIYTPMLPDVDMKVSYEEAKDTVLKALAPLGEEYVNQVKEGFSSRWIDVYENEGKRSGAYSAGVYGRHPFVLLNYGGLLDDMFTLAHEMGHAMHSFLTNKTQPYIYSHYKIFVAEVASTCNEVLLVEYLLSNTKDKKKRASLVNHFLESFKGTLFRQTMFAEYEKTTNALAESGESLTADVLKKVYYDLNCKYFGPEMVSDEEIAMEWARIPHFYYNFYVYQYATGFSAAVAIARRILKEGEPAVKDYMKFLSSGCVMSPVEILKLAGVDMATKQPIEAALAVFGELLDEMEALI